MDTFNLETVLDEIISIEWNMFQNTQNIGGRASCQDDPDTFYIMRASQYANWTEEMLTVWIDFLHQCETSGRNLVTEKYGYMMQYTDLHYFNKHVKHHLPVVPLAHYRLINIIVEALIGWEKEFAAAFPMLSRMGRPITSEGDASGFTSMETYARGELETYPLQLLELYATYVKQLKEGGQSLAMMNQLTMVQLYGYDTIEEAEASLK